MRDALKKAETRLMGEGRVLLRSSGTEPVIRVMVEAENESLCNETALILADEVRKADESRAGLCESV